MELAVMVTIGVLVLLGGTVMLLSKQRMLPWSLPAFKTSGGGAGVTETELNALARIPGSDEMVEPLLSSATAIERPTIMEGTQALSAEERAGLPSPLRVDLVPSPAEAMMARLDQFEARLDQIAQVVEHQSSALGQEFRRIRTDLMHRAEADEARRDAALERLRADMLSAISRAAADGISRTGAKRPEVCAELYARLARLEAALAAVTNPVLLPGETYAPPAELLPEALVWENWNEVGERAFSFADVYSAQRLHLSEGTRIEVDVFVTTLRTLLTRAVYPNLHLEPDATQQVALREALEEIAAELLKVREKLEWEYREGPLL